MSDSTTSRQVVEIGPSIRRAWGATLGYFLLHGLIVATWVGRIPEIQTNLRLSNGSLGLTLLSTALGAVISIPLTGFALPRLGSKRMTSWATVAFASSVVLPGFAVGALSLAAALLCFGAAAAAMDVSMNAQGVAVEKLLGQPTMSRFHGMFSLGAMAGAAVGGVLAAHGLRALPYFAGSAVLYLCGAILLASFLIPDISAGSAAGKAERLPLNRIPLVLLALSAIGFCILLSEGAMADWTAVYLRQIMGAGPGIAAAGYSVFSGAMAIFRFLGDWITARLGSFHTVLAGSILGAVGLLWALSVHQAVWALPGFAAVGIGFSTIIPLVFGAGGRVPGVHPGAGIATITGLGYLGFIAGPPAIGFVAQWSNLRWGLGVVLFCCGLSAALSPALKKLGAPAP